MGSEMETLKEKKNALENQIDDLQEKIQTLEENKTTYERQKKHAEERVKSIEKDNKWVPEQKDQFGVEGGDFDFVKNPIEEIKEELTEAERALKDMEGKVNKQVQQQFQRNNEEAKELRKKKKLVEEDRKTLQGVITNLEEKKKNA